MNGWVYACTPNCEAMLVLFCSSLQVMNDMRSDVLTIVKKQGCSVVKVSLGGSHERND